MRYLFQVVQRHKPRQLIVESCLHWTNTFVIYFSGSSDTNHDSLLQNTTYTGPPHLRYLFNQVVQTQTAISDCNEHYVVPTYLGNSDINSAKYDKGRACNKWSHCYLLPYSAPMAHFRFPRWSKRNQAGTSSNISYKSFKTWNLPCKIPTVITETFDIVKQPLQKETVGSIDILYTLDRLDSASNYSAIQKLKP